MSQFLHLPREVYCPEGHRLPHPRICPAMDDASEQIVGTCVPCGRFYLHLEGPYPYATGVPTPYAELVAVLGELSDELEAMLRERGTA